MTPRPSCPSLFPYTTLFRSCALCDPCCFSPGGPRLLGRCALGICKRYEVALPPIHGEEIRDHLPSYGQRGSIGIPFLFFSFIDQGQSMILSRCQLRNIGKQHL